MIEIFQDIREIYDFAHPREELAPYVEFFSETSSAKCDQHFDKGHHQVTMFQSWTPTFYINLRGSYVIDLDGRQHNVSEGQDILILRNGEVNRRNLAGDRIFTVKFYPGGLEAILGFNQAGMADQVIDLKNVLPLLMLAKIKQPISFEERLALIQTYLADELAKRRPVDHYSKIVNDAIGEYNSSGMQLNTSQVAERLFITSKTINRYFHRVVGLPPKAYFSILRARATLTAYVTEKQNFDPCKHGYFDPAHFYKDIVKFTKKNLKAFGPKN